MTFAPILVHLFCHAPNGQLIDFINRPDQVLGNHINFTLTKSTSQSEAKLAILTGSGGALSTTTKKELYARIISTLTKLTILILFYYLDICMFCTTKG